MKTTCPLDCYDACSVVYEDNKLKGDPNHPFTKGVLCPNLNGFLRQDRILKPRYNADVISMDEALEILVSNLKKNQDKPSLLFRGSGNFGMMQEVTNLFFSKYGSTFTKGSLCDGAGEAGIISGRGESLSLPPSEIEKSEVVVVWGRDITTTNSHILPFLEDKTLIVIDPVKTKLAKKADIHVQLRPRSDFFLATLWSRFVLLEEMEDLEFIEKFTEDYDYFVDFIRGYGIKYLIDEVDVTVKTIMDSLIHMRDKKVIFLVGVGVQKYIHGSEVLRAIDSLAAMLGLFGKEGSGVSYLGSSKSGFTNPFEVNIENKVAKPTVDFGSYNTIFIQGANPASQMPDSLKVQEGIKNADFSIYFGLYENESSKLANLVIPASTFLEKEDVRLSYGTDFVGVQPKLIDSDIGISEYDLTAYLMKSFNFGSLKSENEYIENIIKSNSKNIEGFLKSNSYEKLPYSEGFYTDDNKFIFIDEIEDEKKEIEEGSFFLITSKYKKSLNSQFNIDNFLYISPNCGFLDGELVRAISETGTFEFEVRVSEDLRDDCVKIYSGSKGVNFLTPSLKSNDGDSAVFQEVIIKLEKV